MTETLANGYSSESTLRELPDEYRDDRVLMFFKKMLPSCALDESSLSIGRVNDKLCPTLSEHMCTPYIIERMTKPPFDNHIFYSHSISITDK